MMSKVCPECDHIADYDPYFKAYFCRQCGWMANAPKKKDRIVFKLHKPSSDLKSTDCADCKELVFCK